jgi:CheY-like chemotaxis protein
VTQVLIIDDDADSLEALGDLLEEEGYGVLRAGSGFAGLDALRTAHPDLILLDLMMPGMNGWEFLDARAGDPAAASIPVLVLSADRDPAGKIGGYAVAGCITKPVDVDVLLHAVRGAVPGQWPR